MERKPLISVVFSFRNEENVLPELTRRLGETFLSLPVEAEWIFVNDASTDGSLPLLMEKALQDSRIKIINMSRRFGVYECASAGIRHAKGDAVILLDADLQDPPEVIPQLIEKWREGADLAYTVRTGREGESAIKTLLTRWGYRLIRRVSDIDLTVDAGYFKLMSRRLVNELIRLNEKEPYLHGLIHWVGFKQVPIYYQRRKRFAGRSHFPLYSRGPIGTFLSGLTSFSALPMTLFLGLGLFLCVGSLGGLGAIPIASHFRLPLPKYLGFICLVTLMAGIQLTGIGTLGLYVGKIYNEVRNRPRYIVESTVGFEEKP